MNTKSIKRTGLISARITAIFGGGYALTGGATALVGISLHNMGMALSDAMLLTSICGFLLYVCIIIWAFSAPLKHRPATSIVVLAIATMGLASVLAPIGGASS